MQFCQQDTSFHTSGDIILASDLVRKLFAVGPVTTSGKMITFKSKELGRIWSAILFLKYAGPQGTNLPYITIV